jgi:hypothetical protein
MIAALDRWYRQPAVCERSVASAGGGWHQRAGGAQVPLAREDKTRLCIGDRVYLVLILKRKLRAGSLNVHVEQLRSSLSPESTW